MTSRNVTTNKYKIYALALDCLVIIISLICSWIIRAQFPFFLFDARYFAVILPYVMVLRIIINIFLEHYNKAYHNLQMSDIFSLFIHNIPASFIFLLLRLFAPLEAVRMPLSMIFTEYIFTVLGMILSRLLIMKRIQKKMEDENIRRKRIAILIGDIKELDDPLDITIINNEYNIDIIGILSNKQIDWNTEYRGVLIIGGYNKIDEVAVSNNALSIAIFAGYINYDERIRLLKKCCNLSLDILILKNNKLKRMDIIDATRRDSVTLLKIPDEVEEYLIGKKVLWLGEESIIFKTWKRIYSSVNYFSNSASIFDDFLEVISSNNPDIVIDLSNIIFSENYPCTSILQKWILKHIKNINSLIESKKAHMQYVILVPLLYDLSFIVEAMKANSNATLLFVNNVLSNRIQMHINYNDLNNYWEYPEDILSFIFKSVYYTRRKEKVLYAHSKNIISTKELITVLPLIDIGVTKLEKNDIKPRSISIDSLLKNNFSPTTFVGLFELKGNSLTK